MVAAAALTPRERVEAIARTMRDPRSIEWIADQANVGHEAAVTIVFELHEDGILREVDGKYEPDSEYLYEERVERTVSSFEKAELVEQINEIDGTISDWKEEYQVESRRDFEAAVADGQFSIDERRKRSKIVGRWDKLEQQRQILTEAYSQLNE